jgi:hypothetical protein
VYWRNRQDQAGLDALDDHTVTLLSTVATHRAPQLSLDANATFRMTRRDGDADGADEPLGTRRRFPAPAVPEKARHFRELDQGSADDGDNSPGRGKPEDRGDDGNDEQHAVMIAVPRSFTESRP